MIWLTVVAVILSLLGESVGIHVIAVTLSLISVAILLMRMI